MDSLFLDTQGQNPLDCMPLKAASHHLTFSPADFFTSLFHFFSDFSLDIYDVCLILRTYVLYIKQIWIALCLSHSKGCQP
jgi:hypothetical protein